jgi:hypothetical protein
MNTVESLYLALVIVAALAFMGTLAYVASQTEKHLAKRDKELQ